MTARPIRLAASLAGWALVALAASAPAAAQEEGVPSLLLRLETALQSGSETALEPLLAPTHDSAAVAAFQAGWYSPGITRAVVRERDRTAGPEGAQRLELEVLLEYGNTARMLTWQADAVNVDGRWQFASLSRLASIEGLQRLQLDTAHQFRATDFRIAAEDFELVLARGDVFLCRVPGGITAAVLLGRGEMVFHPAPHTEQRQLELFSGRPVLRAPFGAAFVRVNPGDARTRLDLSALGEVPASPAAVTLAQQVFRTESVKSFAVDLGELSRDSWSLVPPHGDFLAEVRTGRFGTLTYVQTGDEPEDISLFDRARRRNISIYASRERLASRGPFYHEDDDTSYDVLDYSVDATFTPDRLWFDGRSSVRLRLRTDNVGSISLRLNSSFAVRAVTSPEHGRLLFLRVKNQNSLVVNLPVFAGRGTELTLSVLYSGRLEPQAPESEAQASVGLGIPGEIEPGYVYSNRSYWYPQGSVTDYATASIRLTLPPEYGASCSGVPASGSPVTVRQPIERRIFVFTSPRPVRYLGCAIARFVQRESSTLDLSASGTDGAALEPMELEVLTGTRMRARGRELLSRLEDIAKFYAGVMQDAPYPRFSLAVLESHIPGGHSPPYLAAYNQPLPGTAATWTNDPTAFENYPEFFLAHEIAHQWWGHAIGWQNYHEQWLSEGFSQYFAALYAEHRRGSTVFGSIIRQMSRWAVRASPEGPVYLGYRLGHLKGDARIVRALMYNKGAMVLHMLRRLVGDEAFFRGLRSFYTEHRFQKTGTDALRAAFERETGHNLTRFFDRWIYGWTLPSLSHESRVEKTGDESVLVLRFSQRGEVFDLPVTVALRFTDGRSREVVLPITEQTMEHRIAFTGSLRNVQVNADRAALLAQN